MKRRTFISAAAASGALLLLNPAALSASPTARSRRKKSDPYHFVHLSDVQYGWLTHNAPPSEKPFGETPFFQRCIDAINRWKPAFVIITGDHVNVAFDPDQLAEFKRMVAQIDPSIPVYLVPGNHDLENEAPTENVRRYEALYGVEDHFSATCGDTYLIGINTEIIWADNQALEAEQRSWLKKELKKSRKYDKTILVSHHPFFIREVDEADQYENIPLSKRKSYLDLFAENGVNLLLSGHLHYPASGSYKGMQLRTAGAVGVPLENSRRCFSIGTIWLSGIEWRSVDIEGDLPDQL